MSGKEIIKEEISKSDIKTTIHVIERFNIGDDIYTKDYLKDWKNSLICLPWRVKLFKPGEPKIEKALNVIDSLNVEDGSNLLESLKKKKKELKVKPEKHCELSLEPSVASATNWQIRHPAMGDYLMCKNKTDTNIGDFYKLIQKKHNIRFCGHAYHDESYTCIDFYVYKDCNNDKRIKFDIFDGRMERDENTRKIKWYLYKTQSYISSKQANKEVNSNIIVFKNIEGMEHFYQCKIIEGTKLIEVVEVEPMAKKK